MQITFTGDAGYILKGDKATVALALDSKQVGDESVVITRTSDDAPKPKKGQAVIDWPGEYESAGVAVFVIPTGADQSGRVVKIMLDDVAICHLTDLREPLNEKEEEKIGNIDILFVPAGASHPLGLDKLQQAVESVDPRLVVPMQASAEEAAVFGKRLGFAELATETVLKVSKSSLPADRMEMRFIAGK